MFITLAIYFKRLTDALENVVAPEIESDYVRGQAFAIVDLIRQLIDRVEYKQELIVQEIQITSDSIKKMIEALKQVGCAIPDEIQQFMISLMDASSRKNLAMRNKTDEMFCKVFELFHQNLDKIPPETSKAVDKAIRDNIMKVIGRDLGLMKPPMIEKISRSKR